MAQTVVQLCKSKGIEHIIISPGSRNAPLTIGFTSDPYFKCYSIVDERCAGFFALGIAQQIKRPAAVVCTSGSALLNYYPAVAEAYYSNIPLIVLSADRPKHLIGIGDGQTINQKYVFDNHVVYSGNLKLDLKDEKNVPTGEELPIMKNLENKFERFLGIEKSIQKHNEEAINTAINSALVKSGPTHINIPLDEPLYKTVERLSVTPELIDISEKENEIDDYTLRMCLDHWDTSKKKLILVGTNNPNEIDQKWIDELAEDESVIVMTETTSNLHNPSFFPSIDQIIAPLTQAEEKQFQPDILMTFGGMIVSKKIKALLRKYQPKQHWHVDPHNANDTFFCLDTHIKTTPNEFFKAFLPKVTHYVKSDYRDIWTTVKQKRLRHHSNYLAQIPFSDLKAFEILVKAFPTKSIIQSANSSIIRYLQLFKINRNIEVFCNRGTSGIDGSTSTAIGCASINDKQTVLVTGDLSFFYDSNALWNNYIPKNFRVILINNKGGGIFRILPGNKNTEIFDTYFETTHQMTAELLCKMYGFAYQSVSNESGLKESLRTFYMRSKSPKLLEIFTPRELNDTVLLDYFNSIK